MIFTVPTFEKKRPHRGKTTSWTLCAGLVMALWGGQGLAKSSTVYYYRTVPISVSQPGKIYRAESVRTLGTLSAFESQVVALTNQERAYYGLAPLRLDSRVIATAQQHALQMAQYETMAHSLDGTQAGDRLKTVGYQWSAWGENIAYGQESPDDVMQAWMNSPAHRANILNPNYTVIGVGAQEGANGYLYHCQVFARPAGE